MDEHDTIDWDAALHAWLDGEADKRARHRTEMRLLWLMAGAVVAGIGLMAWLAVLVATATP